MPDEGHSPTRASLITAAVSAFAMIATQVAGKAVRDALFLSEFDISSLPVILTASALVSLVAVLLTARAITFYGPRRVIPPMFLVSGVLLGAEWLLAGSNARLASVFVYFHVAVLGSILISGFWSIINEHFDPRSARSGIARIVGAATLGGLFGGFLADRMSAMMGIVAVLPVIAALHLVCALLLPRLGSAQESTRRKSLRDVFGSKGRASTREGFGVMRRVSYIRNLALIVLLGNIAATFVDFLFKARAASSYGDPEDLVRFFAIFYTAVSLFTMAVQAGMTRQLLERIGVANTMAVRPGLLTVGGLLTLPWMGLAGLGFLRGIESVAHSSMFRSGYELLYTAVSPDLKRKTKTIVDVGADRMGDVIGGLVTRLVILLPLAVSGHVLMLLAVGVSVAGFVVARALRRGYVAALETSLRDRAAILKDEGPASAMLMESFAGLDLSLSIDAADLSTLRGDTSATHVVVDTEPPVPAAASAPVRIADPEIARLVELRSGDAHRVRAELRTMRSMSPGVAAQVISLLAWDEVTNFASRALSKAAPDITGQLLDRLLDPDEDFAVRRRIPHALGMVSTQRAFSGLMEALGDRRFEVRYQIGRALARIHARMPGIGVSAPAVYAAVLRETKVAKPLWQDQRLLDEPGDESEAVLDSALRARTSRSLEHVITLLSLVLPREPLQIAFRGLLTRDAVLRGTSLEYLESVLPRDVWEGLHPFLDEEPATNRSMRPREAILEDLLRSSPSIELKLAEKQSPPPAAGEAPADR